MEYLKNYTTSIDPSKTVGEIQELLCKVGANQIMIEYDNGHPVSLCFSIKTANGNQGVRLPANTEKMFKVLQKMKRSHPNKKIRDTREQAEKTAWRNVLDWIKVQVSFIQTEMVEFDEIFLPYLISIEGKTMYQLFNENRLLLEDK